MVHTILTKCTSEKVLNTGRLSLPVLIAGCESRKFQFETLSLTAEGGTLERVHVERDGAAENLGLGDGRRLRSEDGRLRGVVLGGVVSERLLDVEHVT
eukprot:5307656-Pleurochrysis_carterae.AAC.3